MPLTCLTASVCTINFHRLASRDPLCPSLTTCGIPSRDRIWKLGVGVLACVLSGLFLSTNVEAADWAEQFTIPFAAQIVHPLGTQAPDDHSATVTTVAGLNIDDPILIDASDGGHYSATVTDIDPAGHVVTWTPALPTGVIAGQNGFIRSKYSLSL